MSDSTTPENCLAFFRSVIKSGEAWSEICDRDYAQAIQGLRALRQRLSELEKWQSEGEAMNTDFSKAEIVELIFAADEKRHQLIAANSLIFHERILNLSTAINELKARLKHLSLKRDQEEA